MYQITFIRTTNQSRGLDRRGEKVIWEMFTENDSDCNTFADLKVRAALMKVVMDKVAQDVS